MERWRDPFTVIILLVAIYIILLYIQPTHTGLAIYSTESSSKYQDIAAVWDFSDNKSYNYNPSEIKLDNKASLNPNTTNYSWYETTQQDYSLISAIYGNTSNLTSVNVKDDSILQINNDKLFDVKFNGSLENNDTIVMYLKSGSQSNIYLCEASANCTSPGYGMISYSGQEDWYNITLSGLTSPKDAFNAVLDNVSLDFIKATHSNKYEKSSLNITYPLQSTIQTEDIFSIRQMKSLIFVDELNNQSIEYKYSTDSGTTWNTIPPNVSSITSQQVRFSATLISNKTIPILRNITLIYDKIPPKTYFEIDESGLVNLSYSESVLINHSDVLLNLTADIDIYNVNVTITEFANTSMEALKPIRAFMDIIVDNHLKNNLSNIVLTVFYTDKNLAAMKIKETTLDIYSYNSSSNTWELLESKLDTDNNFIEAILPHLSIYGVFGDKINPATQIQEQVNVTETQNFISSENALQQESEESQNITEEQLFEEEIFSKEKKDNEKGITGFVTHLKDIGLGNAISLLAGLVFLVLYLVNRFHKRDKQESLDKFTK